MNSPFPSPYWRKILELWRQGQTEMKKVLRWQEPVDLRGPRRTQDSLQHSYAITWLVPIFVQKLARYIKLDAELLLIACLIHDQGEGLMGRDIVWSKKSEEYDLEEYSAFVKAYHTLPIELFLSFQHAFLLQFALTKPQSFPSDAQKIMAELAQEKHHEAWVFKAIERWDYFLFALEQYETLGNRLLLAHIVKCHCEEFDELTKKLPGFGKIWTIDIRQWCVEFERNYSPKE